MSEAEHEYVEFELTFDKGECVACRFYGEGKQVDPLTGPVMFVPMAGGISNPIGLARAQRHVERVFRSLSRS